MFGDDNRLSGFHHYYSDRTRRTSHFSSAKSRALSERMNRRRRDLLLVQELSVIGEAADESSIGSSSTTNLQAPSAPALVNNRREDEDHDYSPWRSEQLNPCPQTTDVVWSPEEDGKTAHPKGANSRARRVFSRSVYVFIESFQPRLSAVNRALDGKEEQQQQQQQCVDERPPRSKDDCAGNGVQDSENKTQNVALVVPSQRGRCCSLYQTSRVFQWSILLSIALLLCSIALVGVSVGVRNKGNQKHHSGSASSIRRGPTLSSSTWSDVSHTAPPMHPSLYPARMQSLIPTGAIENVPSDAPSLLLRVSTSPSIPRNSESMPTASLVPTSIAAPSVRPTNIPSEAPSVLPQKLRTSTEPSILPSASAISPPEADIFVGPAPPEINWPF
jgi:hypothetical protein